MVSRSTAGFGSLRRTFHTTILIDSILRAGGPRMNLSSHPKLEFGVWHAIPLTGNLLSTNCTESAREGKILSMTWIRTVTLGSADEKLCNAMEAQKKLYPAEYATPVHPAEGGGSEIVASHSLIPDALYHAFSTFGVLMSPDLPLSRRQHEMITTMVSVTNRCVY